MWLGVSDLAAAAGFYASVPGIRQTRVVPGQRVHFGIPGRDGTLALVADGRPVTRNAAIAVGGRRPFCARDPDGTRLRGTPS